MLKMIRKFITQEAHSHFELVIYMTSFGVFLSLRITDGYPFAIFMLVVTYYAGEFLKQIMKTLIDDYLKWKAQRNCNGR